MQHEAVWILPPQGESEGPTFITRTAPITQRPITYLLIGLLSLFGTHAAAKSEDECVSWAFEGGHEPCGDLKVSDAIDHQREARARVFIFPNRSARRGHRRGPAARSAGHGRVDHHAAGPGRRP